MIKGGKEGQDDLSGGGRIRQTKPIARAHGRTDSIVLIVSEAVRTSVLFSRWRYKQTTLPELVFDDDCTPSSFDDESSALAQVGGPETVDTVSNFWKCNRSPCSLSQLKFVSFTGNQGTMLETGFIKFQFLQFHMLQRMEIRAAGDSGGPPAGDTLLGNRASLTSSQEDIYFKDPSTNCLALVQKSLSINIDARILLEMDQS
ncbi:hypothetical protein CDL15_Pgr017666 [Punica granatum]|uniref:FBD domain-containing protein n=1 Tax=Punica granatum TaxID=22663 RepID=A0A218WYL4_PUNGR|nr:hypothetical protein CDL15_Pgr017666 [Punica granatum]